MEEHFPCCYEWNCSFRLCRSWSIKVEDYEASEAGFFPSSVEKGGTNRPCWAIIRHGGPTSTRGPTDWLSGPFLPVFVKTEEIEIAKRCSFIIVLFRRGRVEENSFTYFNAPSRLWFFDLCIRTAWGLIGNWWVAEDQWNAAKVSFHPSHDCRQFSY